MSLVGLIECKDRNVNSIKEAVKKALELINYSFPKAKRIVIKPNMCYYWDYSTGQTTDPNFVAALIEMFREEISPDIEISIVESDASAMKCKYVFKYLGYEKLAKKYRVNLVNLSEAESETAKVKVKDEVFEFLIPKVIKNADLRVNVPKMKYMTFTKISCALKNIFGCNPYPKKFKYHPKLDEVIVALNKIMPFDLHFLDGLIVCGSKTLKLGLIMVSQDPVAMDAAAATIMSVNPKSVDHVMLAEKEELGKSSFAVRGVDLEYFRKRFPKRGFSEKAIAFGYKVVCAIGLDKRLI
ncbi:DUF362 domain-containing protein [Candidatus Bathyarchaeota archaeon]|nr:DUF362 domain-containing protein [Candidatus Bathyarchaeota archaeon]